MKMTKSSSSAWRRCGVITSATQCGGRACGLRGWKSAVAEVSMSRLLTCVQPNDSSSEELIVESTFAAILDEIKKVPLATADVQLGKTVVNVLSASTAGTPRVTITTEDGE